MHDADAAHRGKFDRGRTQVKVYIDTADWWIGYYRGPNHHYVCPVPTVVIRWRRRIEGGRK